MNTLTLIKKQIHKAAALHDAQISHTAYRGVEYDQRNVESKRLMALSAIAGGFIASESILCLSLMMTWIKIQEARSRSNIAFLTYRGVHYAKWVNLHEYLGDNCYWNRYIIGGLRPSFFYVKWIKRNFLWTEQFSKVSLRTLKALILELEAEVFADKDAYTKPRRSTTIP